MQIKIYYQPQKNNMRIIKENIKLSDGEIVEMTSLYQLSWEEKKDYAKLLINVAKLAGQDPKDHVYEWLRVADLLILINSKKNNSPIGFSASRFFGNDNVIHIAALMIVPDYRKKDIGTRIIKKIARIFFVNKIKRELKRPLNIFKPFYFLFRTQNPTAYFNFYKYNLLMHPNFKNNNVKPNEKIINIASKFAKELWPYATFNKDTFVLEGAYRLHPNLAIDPNNIPWCKSDLINQEFKKRLNLDKKSYDALLVMVEVNFFSAFKAFF